MAIDYVALKNEILTDPKAYGYATPFNAGADNQVAALLNQVRAGEQIPQSSLHAWQIFNAVLPADYQSMAATTIKMNYFQSMLTAGIIDLSNSNVKSALDLIFPSATNPTTNAAIHALYTRNGSRAETLFGPGTVIQASDVSQARVS